MSTLPNMTGTIHAACTAVTAAHFTYTLIRKEDNYFGDFLKVAHVVKFGKHLTQLYSGTFHRSYMFRPQRVIIRIVLSKTLKNEDTKMR